MSFSLRINFKVSLWGEKNPKQTKTHLNHIQDLRNPRFFLANSQAIRMFIVNICGIYECMMNK